MTTIIPTLSEEAWVSSTRSILNQLLAWYILTDAAQTITFQDQLINLPETYYKNINDPEGMAVAVRSDLEKLLGRHFESIDVTVTAKQNTLKYFYILIYASVLDSNGVKYELSKVAEIDSSGLRNIIQINNYGDGVSYLNNL